MGQAWQVGPDGLNMYISREIKSMNCRFFFPFRTVDDLMPDQEAYNILGVCVIRGPIVASLRDHIDWDLEACLFPKHLRLMKTSSICCLGWVSTGNFVLLFEIRSPGKKESLRGLTSISWKLIGTAIRTASALVHLVSARNVREKNNSLKANTRLF